MLQLQLCTTWATPTHHLSGLGQVSSFLLWKMVQETERLEEMTKSIMLTLALVTMDSLKFHLGLPSTPYWQVTPETALQAFQGWPTCRAGGLRLSSTPLNTPSCMPMKRDYVHEGLWINQQCSCVEDWMNKVAISLTIKMLQTVCTGKLTEGTKNS
jgi:hypothetical protein